MSKEAEELAIAMLRTAGLLPPAPSGDEVIWLVRVSSNMLTAIPITAASLSWFEKFEVEYRYDVSCVIDLASAARRVFGTGHVFVDGVPVFPPLEVDGLEPGGDRQQLAVELFRVAWQHLVDHGAREGGDCLILKLYPKGMRRLRPGAHPRRQRLAITSNHSPQKRLRTGPLRPVRR